MVFSVDLRNVGSALVGVVDASSIKCGVWVIIVRLLTVVGEIFPSQGIISSVATTVGGAAVDQLLGRKFEKRSTVKAVSTFHSFSCGESPA